MSTETLDKPEDKRLFGIDLKIDRYRLINPDKNELLILTEKSFNPVLLFFVVLFAGLGTWSIYMGATSDSRGVNPLLLLFGWLICISPMAIAIFGAWSMFFSKAKSHFTETELIDTNMFGRNKIIPRSAVERVYVTYNSTVNQHGRETNGNYTVDVKVPYPYSKDGKITLISFQSKSFASRENAHRIAHIIAAHWQLILGAP
jgi:hypothetical protein